MKGNSGRNKRKTPAIFMNAAALFLSLCLTACTLTPAETGKYTEATTSAQLTESAAFAFTKQMTTLLQTEFTDIPLRVLGPSQAAVFKVSNKYRFKLILKCRNDSRFREMLARMLVQFSSNREFGNVTVYADMDPLNL